MKKRSAKNSLSLALWAWIGFFCATVEVHAQLQINELSASNGAVLSDEDGEYPDWIELRNASDTTINLSGYGISDDPEELFKYVLTQKDLEPGEYYTMYASDKDREGFTTFWETIIRNGDNTKYIVPTSMVSDEWVQNGFNDEYWQDGIFGIGYNDNDDATIVPNGTISVFSRTTFSIEDLDAINRVLFHIDYDDGFIAYLNGVEISRENLAGDAPVPFNTFANTYTEPRLFQGLDLEPYVIDNFRDLLVEGDNVLAIQMHNNSTGSSDLTMIPFLSIGTTSRRVGNRGTADELNLPLLQVVNPHLNFKLSATGETIYLTNPDEVIVDTVAFPELLEDESFGRLADSGDWVIFADPTPSAQNGETGYSARLKAPELSEKSGFYTQKFDLSLVHSDTGDNVYFTVDGSVPTKNDLAFGTGSRNISGNFTLRFRHIEDGKLPSPVVTHTYIIGTDHDLPVVMLSTDPENLWSDENGIYVEGTNGIAGPCGRVANWSQDWEIPVNIELLEKNGESAFNSGAGAKIFGGCSRDNAQKSLSIFFRSEYGTNELEYKLFESKDIDKFQALVLRNSGNDGTEQGHSQMRDGLMTSLVADTKIDVQAFRQAVLYLNGEYWGIHNIREKVNEHFVESNNAADSENLDLLEGNGWVVHGTNEKYYELLDFLNSANLYIPGSLTNVEEFMDLESFIDYNVAEIYFANTDWPGNNIKFWRARSNEGKFKWILYDTDFGFHLSYGGHTDHNTLDFALEAGNSDWPNPDWSTRILRNLVTSDEFVKRFANRMADLLNTNFKPENVISLIDSLSGNIESEIPKHVQKWGQSVSVWNSEISTLKYFAQYRPNFIVNDFKDEFGLTDLKNLTVDVEMEGSGDIKVNRVEPVNYPWSGKYFGNNPVKLTAIPAKGYEFEKWSGASESEEEVIEILPGTAITAHFKPSGNDEGTVVINEILYNAPDEEDPGDWVELHNPGTSEISLSGWVLKDEDDDHEFVFNSDVVIAADSYLIVAQSIEEFELVYTDISPVGDMGFGLAGGSDQVRLYDNTGLLIDSLQYDDEDPWTSGADGTGFTLELTDPSSDNTLPESWVASNEKGGSPGRKNSVSVVNESEKGDLPTQLVLHQNYPNPFNPSTIISFDLPEEESITLSIFDMLGRRVAVLVEGKLNAGYHSYKWGGSSAASGVYFYRLETGSKRISGKMMLIK